MHSKMFRLGWSRRRVVRASDDTKITHLGRLSFRFSMEKPGNPSVIPESFDDTVSVTPKNTNSNACSCAFYVFCKPWQLKWANPESLYRFLCTHLINIVQWIWRKCCPESCLTHTQMDCVTHRLSAHNFFPVQQLKKVCPPSGISDLRIQVLQVAEISPSVQCRA